jgi:hypothetical protein
LSIEPFEDFLCMAIESYQDFLGISIKACREYLLGSRISFEPCRDFLNMDFYNVSQKFNNYQKFLFFGPNWKWSAD